MILQTFKMASCACVLARRAGTLARRAGALERHAEALARRAGGLARRAGVLARRAGALARCMKPSVPSKQPIANHLCSKLFRLSTSIGCPIFMTALI